MTISCSSLFSFISSKEVREVTLEVFVSDWFRIEKLRYFLNFSTPILRDSLRSSFLLWKDTWSFALPNVERIVSFSHPLHPLLLSLGSSESCRIPQFSPQTQDYDSILVSSPSPLHSLPCMKRHFPHSFIPRVFLLLLLLLPSLAFSDIESYFSAQVPVYFDYRD